MSAFGIASSCGELANRWPLHLGETGGLAELEHLLTAGGRKQMHHPSDDAGPSGLVARAQAGSVVPVKVLVGQNQISPMRVLLEPPRAPVDRSASVGSSHKDASQPTRELLADLIQRHVAARAGGTLQSKIIAIICVVL